MKKNASILDWITEDIASLQRQFRARATAARSTTIWTPFARWSAGFRRPRRRPRIQPAARSIARSAFRPHTPIMRKLMFDLQVLALQADITRVITFQLARETSNRTYPEIGVSDPHHPLTHHGGNPEKMEKVAKINAFHVSLFAYFLES